MSATDLQALLATLDVELASGPRGGARVTRGLERFARTSGDWRRYALFSAERYARNLVRRTELYELLVLCWHPGQVTPVHDHQSQRCWMAVLAGEVRETQFRMPIPGVEQPLEAIGTRHLQAGSVAFITDEIGLHEIAPAGEEQAVTLHLYSRPIAACRVFDPATGRVSMRQLDYHSVEGVGVAAP